MRGCRTTAVRISRDRLICFGLFSLCLLALCESYFAGCTGFGHPCHSLFVLGVLHFGVLRNYQILSALNLPQMSLAKRAVPTLVVKYRAQKDRRATVNSIAIRARMTFTCGDHGQ